MQQKGEKPTRVWVKKKESHLTEDQAAASDGQKETAAGRQPTELADSQSHPEEKTTPMATGHVPATGESGPEVTDQEGHSSNEGTSAEEWKGPMEKQPPLFNGAEERENRSGVGQEWEEQLNRDWGIGEPPPGNESETEKEEEPEAEDQVPGEETAPASSGEYRKPAGVLMWKKDDPQGVGKVDSDSAPDKKGEGESGLRESVKEQDGEKTENKKEQRKSSTTKKVLLFTFVWFPLLLVAALAGGLLIGYSVIGDDPAGDVFTRDLWEHLYNLIYG